MTTLSARMTIRKNKIPEPQKMHATKVASIMKMLINTAHLEILYLQATFLIVLYWIHLQEDTWCP